MAPGAMSRQQKANGLPRAAWRTSPAPDAEQDYLMPRDSLTLKLGDSAPDFTLPAENEERIQLSSYRRDKPLLLFFFRGTW